MGKTKQQTDGTTTRKRTSTNTAGERVLGLLPKLSVSELKQARGHLDALLSLREQQDASGVDEKERLVYDCMIREVGKGGSQTQLLSYYEFKRRYKTHNKLLEAASESLQQYAQHAGVSKKVDRISFYTLCFSCLKSRLQKRGESTGPVSLLKHYDELFDALDESFPGYVENGLLGFILKRNKARK